jgi:hypothetical protein
MLPLSSTRRVASNQLVSPKSDEGGSADVPAPPKLNGGGSAHSKIRIPNSALAKNSFPEFILEYPQ